MRLPTLLRMSYSRQYLQSQLSILSQLASAQCPFPFRCCLLSQWLPELRSSSFWLQRTILQRTSRIAVFKQQSRIAVTSQIPVNATRMSRILVYFAPRTSCHSPSFEGSHLRKRKTTSVRTLQQPTPSLYRPYLFNNETAGPVPGCSDHFSPQPKRELVTAGERICNAYAGPTNQVHES
jgi:hypothetical protein